MKKTLISLVAFFTWILAYGQLNSYHPFPDSAFWRIDILVSSPQNGGCLATYYFHYYTSGDTVINSFVYKKIFKSFVALTSSGPASPCDPIPPVQFSGYIGALRDDAAARKSFFVFPGFSNDSLLFDYNLNSNDTVKGFIVTNCTTVVSSVDSVFINGQFRKRWNCNACGNPNEYIIEGIGSSYGLIERFANSPASQMFGRIICVNDSTNTLFVSGYNSLFGCSLIFNGEIEINFKNNITLAPNPFSVQSTLHSLQPFKNASFTVYNSLGQPVRHIENLNGHSLTLQRNHLPGGLYFFCIRQNGSIISTDKFIITSD